ncbi:MAG: DUF2127 domain-containing protein [Candidatus Njordarchaeales archaeon]
MPKRKKRETQITKAIKEELHPEKMPFGLKMIILLLILDGFVYLLFGPWLIPLAIAVFSTAIGLIKRKRWSWYAGLILSFLYMFIESYTLHIVFNFRSLFYFFMNLAIALYLAKKNIRERYGIEFT